jgi:hypothetical protein
MLRRKEKDEMEEREKVLEQMRQTEEIQLAAEQEKHVDEVFKYEV